MLMSDIKIKNLEKEKFVKDKIQELINFRKENKNLKELWGIGGIGTRS